MVFAFLHTGRNLFMPYKATSIAGLITALAWCLLAAPACAGVGKEDIHIQNGHLTRDNDAITIKAIMAPELLAGLNVLGKTSPVLAGIAHVGGNTACTDLPGFNADGSAIDPAGIAAIGGISSFAKEQHMALMIRVLGGETDPAFCAKAVETAANALKNERRALYYFDGPDADKYAARFMELAPNLAVASPNAGHVKVVSDTPPAPAGQPTLVVGKAHGHVDTDTHFLVGGAPEDYAAVDAALTTEVEKQPWTPDNSVLSEEERAEGFVALANGKNFDGWWFPNEENSFVVNERGEFEFVKPGGKVILTRNRYSNFILRLDYKIEEGGNSGIFFRAPRACRQSKIGFEFQIHGDPGVAVGDDMTGAVYKVVPPRVNASNPPMEWNSVEVMLDGGRIKATLNGQVIHNFDMDTVEVLRYRLKEGFIGLQDHDHFVAFRNVRIKEL